MPRDAVSRTANVGTVGINGLKRIYNIVNQVFPDDWLLYSQAETFSSVLRESQACMYNVVSIGGTP